MRKLFPMIPLMVVSTAAFFISWGEMNAKEEVDRWQPIRFLLGE